MDSNITEEELDIFLKEAGILKASSETTHQAENQARKEETLDKLLEEIIDSVRPTSSSASSPIEEKIPPFLFKKLKEIRPRLRFFALGLSISLLGGVFLGTIFGFYWGKTQKQNSIVTSFDTLDSKLGLLRNEIQAIHEKITQFSPPEEMIEPIEPLEQLEELMSKKLS